MTCTHGAKCVLDATANQAQCTCDLQCDRKFAPVCGSDAQSYDNECKMREAGCKAKKDISVVKNDKCGKFVCNELYLN